MPGGNEQGLRARRPVQCGEVVSSGFAGGSVKRGEAFSLLPAIFVVSDPRHELILSHTDVACVCCAHDRTPRLKRHHSATRILVNAQITAGSAGSPRSHTASASQRWTTRS